MTDLHPWQQQTLDSGLMLAAASDILVDGRELVRQTLAAIDSVPVADREHYGSENGDWTAITLARMPANYGIPAGTPTAIMAHLPVLDPIMAGFGGMAHGAYILRQPPRGMLEWHFDNQALHLPFCRLLLTVQAAPEAFTWIGHEKVAFPPGTLWTGDFGFPHQVENAADQERLMIALDYVPTDAIRAHFPPALYAEPDRRGALAGEACNHLSYWRFSRSS
ncbi:aspartyl/asparaginyl beta-hydroxylase domain-containing protein [Niveispirillum sp. KHB5.9]|uniref:aspartyl/asparaginyl beta-hydroxylase domain-containing protein n=1 Tax=Niveispirillum sp. KHB5.9 TaxID=3400269 RepID=UPI003A863AFB